MEGKIPKEQQTTPKQVYTIINYILFLWDKIRSLGQGIIFLKARAESRREKREGKRHEWMLRRFIDRKFVYISHFPFSSFTIRREMWKLNHFPSVFHPRPSPPPIISLTLEILCLVGSFAVTKAPFSLPTQRDGEKVCRRPVHVVDFAPH